MQLKLAEGRLHGRRKTPDMKEVLCKFFNGKTLFNMQQTHFLIIVLVYKFII